jgi:chromosomal replication initiator protein
MPPRINANNTFTGRFEPHDVGVSWTWRLGYTVAFPATEFTSRRSPEELARSLRPVFFHTFNDVTEHGGRLVLTADRHPTEIGTLPDRLRTRLRSGLVANLSAPEVETRRHIVAKKAALTGVELPPEVVDLIATAVTTSVRELEGGLIQVVALARLQRSAVTIEVAREALGGFLGASGQIVTLDRVIDEAARQFGLTPSERCGPGRTRTLVAARHVAVYLCRVLTKESYPAIARAFNKQDHTSVMHAHLKVEQLMQSRQAVYFQVVMHRLGAEPQQGVTRATKLGAR